MNNLEKIKLGVIGMGYVGLPLAIEFGKVRDVIGFDINRKRINDLKNNHDDTLEIPKENFLQAKYLKFTNNLNDISDCNFYIVCVPTPITLEKKPDLSPILSATRKIASV